MSLRLSTSEKHICTFTHLNFYKRWNTTVHLISSAWRIRPWHSYDKTNILYTWCCECVNYVLIILMKKIIDSDWLRAVQLRANYVHFALQCKLLFLSCMCFSLVCFSKNSNCTRALWVRAILIFFEKQTCANYFQIELETVWFICIVPLQMCFSEVDNLRDIDCIRSLLISRVQNEYMMRHVRDIYCSVDLFLAGQR